MGSKAERLRYRLTQLRENDTNLTFAKILDSLGIGQDIWREASHMLEIRFWVEFLQLIAFFQADINRTPTKTTVCIDQMQ